MSKDKPYDLHPEALEDIQEADQWYSERSPSTADDFVASVYAGIYDICGAPQRWPKHSHNARRYLLARFPFSVIYLDKPDMVKIIAVAHHKRRPAYWKRRV